MGPGGPNFGSEKTVERFVADYFSQRRPRISQSVNVGRCGAGNACKQMRTDHRRVPKRGVRMKGFEIEVASRFE